MKIAIIGRTEILYATAVLLRAAGHEITCILTSSAAAEYTRKAEDFRTLALHWKVPFAQGPRISEYVDFLRENNADIAVSINYTGLIPQNVIDVFPLGVLNAHGGDLPRYRGNACQAWAILNGENRIGLCIHRMIGGELDSGDIIARDYLAIDQSTKITAVWEWMTTRTPPLFLDALTALSRNPNHVLERQSENPGSALRCYPRLPEDGRINWQASATDVLRLVNASNKPYRGAFCEFEGRIMTIWDAEISHERGRFCAVPGQITQIGDGFIEVACGDGKLRLLSVEYGASVGSPDRWIRSIRQRLA